MNDSVPAANVPTTLKIGNFTFKIMAYRTLTQSEAIQVLNTWMQSERRTKYPKSGTVTQYTIIGFDS